MTFPIPRVMRQLVAELRSWPTGATFTKRVVAVENDDVCLDGQTYQVNGQVIGAVLRSDRQGAPLEPFRFCGKVPPGTVFVATAAPGSFDSRYFGPVPVTSAIVTRALWTY